jgi:putative peptidoglycan lipid II flippase
MTHPPRALRSTLVLSSTRLTDAVLSIVAGILSAKYFGTSVEKDCYIVAQTLPSLITLFVTAGFYTTLLMMLAEIGRTQGVAGQIRFTRRTLMHTTLPLVPFLAVVLLVPRPLIAGLAPGFGPAQVDLGARLLRMTSLTILAYIALAIVRCLFETRRQFAPPALLGLLVPTVSLITLVGLVRRIGIFSLAVGPLVGVTIAVVLLWILALTRLEDPPGFSPVVPSEQDLAGHHRRFWRSFLPMMLATSFGQVNLVVDNAFASTLPSGSITVLGFAFVIVSNAQLLTIHVIVQVAFPRVVQAALDDPLGLRETMRNHLRHLLLVAAPMSAGALTFGLPLSRALFQRGAFSPASSQGVATALACYTLHILLTGHLLLFARLLIARGRLGRTAWISLASIGLNAVLDWFLIKPFGLYGIALATTFVTLSYFLILFPMVVEETPGLFDSREGIFAAKALASAFAMGVLMSCWAFGFEKYFGITSETARVLELTGGLCVGGLAYLLLLRFFGVSELSEIIRRITRPLLGREI